MDAGEIQLRKHGCKVMVAGDTQLQTKSCSELLVVYTGSWYQALYTFFIYRNKVDNNSEDEISKKKENFEAGKFKTKEIRQQ